MGDAGFFRGTSSDQDGRFPDKEKKLLKQMRFEDALARKINFQKIKLDLIKPWITAKINEILGIEDDVVIEYVMSQLEQKVINPKLMQINITGFLNARCARIFMGELWELLIEADEAEDGIPKSLVEKKMVELKGQGDSLIVKEEAQGDWAHRYDKLSLGRFSGPTKEKGVRDDRMMPSPTRRRRSRSRSPRNGRNRSPPRRREREPDDRDRRRGDRHQEERKDPEEEKRHEEESKRREEERIKRHAEQKKREEERRDDTRKREARKDEVRKRDEERKDDRKKDDRRREERRRRSRERSRSPVRRRFTEGSEKKKRRSDSPGSDEDRHKKRRHAHSSDDEDSHRDRKEKKSKKNKKEKKKKERKRSPSPSSASDTE